ncbi:F-type H+-transporting ATPase subunit delta [Chitinophaga skermanii]|uniref:ATP synthase subunit delta n=1 Tax=Chitinophaga skermanii TaxID=331697 RepID=A0A327QQU3_9BACT|nr:ATP synthase F1 subunit delta [Chitinophaga skermanii]RAJ04157.1 F-type H+-transporting ATPase subunit delta [Chitinophaga skermanii]
MQNPRLASRYAKSLIDLATEKNELEAVQQDMTLLTAIAKSNPDVVALLKSPIIKADKKVKILGAILDGKITAITSAFIRLLTIKGRESFLAEIASEYTKQYNVIKNIATVKVTTAIQLDDAILSTIKQKVEAAANRQVVIETSVKPELIGGFVLETGDKLFDASILRDLNDIRKQFSQNIFVPNFK